MAGLVILENPSRPVAAAFSASGPPPLMHLLSGDPPLVFVVEGSRLFEVDPEYFDQLLREGESASQTLLELGKHVPSNPDRSVVLPPPSAISLNIAHACNLSCSYCYADEGRFGGRVSLMSREVACATIDRLLDGVPGQRVTVGFIGGEPFLNREVLYSTVEYASERAKNTGCRVGFSVTTNGTLLTASDVEFLRDHSFSVSISLDGSAEINDQHRHSRNGISGFGLAMRALAPLLGDPGKARVTARATITRQDLRVAERVDALLRAGFGEVGVSPLRTGPAPELALRDEDWPRFLSEMVRAAEVEWQHLCDGGSFHFSNLAVALKQLHAGYCKPLPCGSAASYVSVSARGEYFTCHRTIDDPRFALGNTAAGLSQSHREDFLRSRHVDRQEPCRSCWARYLCGGGCHAEVVSTGRGGCDYIRGWLEYCLRFYDRTLRQFPALLDRGEPMQ
jgi:uncharacterized protein